MARAAGLLLAWACLPPALGFPSAGDYSPTVESEIQFPEVEDGECVFPFQYKNKIFYDCVIFNAKHKWCSVNKTYQGYWKYCSRTDFAPCVFPFWYRRLVYWECTTDGEEFGRPWCSLTQNYNKDRVWKYC